MEKLTSNQKHYLEVSRLVSAIWLLKLNFANEGCNTRGQELALKFADATLAKYPQFDQLEIIAKAKG